MTDDQADQSGAEGKSSAKEELALVTPAVLRWARESAGYSVAEIANRLKIKPARVDVWERDGELPWGRLRTLANIYRRPVATFFYSTPPVEPERSLPDFRAAGRTIDPRMIYQVRHAHERRELALELLDDLGEPAAPFPFSCRREEDAETVGLRLRAALGVTAQILEVQKQKEQMFGHWKDATEQVGALVFQAARRDLPSARGFSISAPALPVVVVRSSETRTGRLFTLAHELAHLGLQESGLCDMREEGLERFCNGVAAAALMPVALLDQIGATRLRKGDWTDSHIRRFSSLLGVSEQALAIRMLHLGGLPRTFYDEKVREYERRSIDATDSDKRTAGGPSPSVMSLVRNGMVFTRIVFNAYHRKTISAHSASQYLALGVSHFGDVEVSIARHSAKVA